MSEEKAPLCCRATIEIDFECKEVPSIFQVLSSITFDEEFFKKLETRVTQLAGEFEDES